MILAAIVVVIVNLIATTVLVIVDIVEAAVLEFSFGYKLNCIFIHMYILAISNMGRE